MARFWPLWALYGLFWMFAIPLNLMNRYFNYLRWTGGTGTPQDLLLDLAQSIPEYLAPGVWLAALMGLLCAMACFGYLYNNRSACMMHALPMRRETLFVTQYLAGLSFLLLPVAAVALCGVLVELALLFVVGCLVLCLNFYAPLAIGHSFARHKLLWSVVFFFAIQIVIQIIGGVFGLIALPHLWSVNFNFMTAAAAAHAMMWSSILVTAIYGAILYGITLYMLRKRLNLE